MSRAGCAARARAALVCLMIGALGVLAACPSSRAIQPTAPAPLAPAGALRWDELARQLPERAPWVLTIHGSELLHALNGLYQGLVQDPTLFGQEGESIVQGMVNLYSEVRARSSFDPLTARGWASQGLDLKRPILIALYPVDAQDEAALLAAEAQVRQALEIPGEEPLHEAILRRPLARPPQGLYAKLLAVRRAEAPRVAVRLLLPIQDEAKLLDRLDALIESTNMRTALSDSGRELRRVYFYPEAGEGVLTARVVQGALALDFFPGLMPRVEPGQPVAERVRERAEAALRAQPRGAPHAPKPLGRPGLALSTDQRGVARYIRVELWRAALDEASRAALEERDATLWAALHQAARQAQRWEVGVDGVSGLSHELLLSDERRLGALRVTFFGERALKLPEPEPRQHTLALSERSLALGLDASMLFGAAWHSWLGVRRATALRAALTPSRDDAGPDLSDPAKPRVRLALSDLVSASLGLPWLRNVILAPINLPNLLLTFGPLEIIPIYPMRERLSRVEVATHEEELSGFRVKPQVTALVTFKPGLSPAQQDEAAQAWLQTLRSPIPDDPSALFGLGAQRSAPTDDPAPQVQPAAGPLVAGHPTALALDGQHPLRGLSYFYGRGERLAEQGWLLVGLNLDQAQLMREVQTVRAQARPASEAEVSAQALTLRVEPVGLLTALSTFAPASLSWLDLNVLAQRVGPLLLHYRAAQEEGVQVIHTTLEVRRPPSLD